MREWLRSARNHAGMTMLEMSKKLGISESYYSMIESGTRQKKMDIELIVKISDLVKIPITAIIKNEEKASK